MLTRNFDNISVGYLTVLSEITSPTEAQWMSGMPGLFKNINGTIRKTTYYGESGFSLFGSSSSADANVNLSSSSITVHPMLLVGSGTEEETYYDYKIDIINNLNVVGYRSANVAYTAEACKYTTVKTFINNTDSDVTVNEIGLFSHLGSSADILLYRKKLGQPVTLKANSGTATFKLEVDIPYNKP